MNSKKSCRYWDTCGGDNCRKCTGYAKRPEAITYANAWAEGRKDRRSGFPARSANGQYIDGYYGITRTVAP